MTKKSFLSIDLTIVRMYHSHEREGNLVLSDFCDVYFNDGLNIHDDDYKIMLNMVTPHFIMNFINHEDDYVNYDSIQILCYHCIFFIIIVFI
jgi:hypothetical protein